jgi:hypothetical protein
MNFLDIKMMSPFRPPFSSSTEVCLQQKLSRLTPGQFQLSKTLCFSNSLLSAQIAKLQQPSVVNIQNYTPKDADFIHLKPKASRAKGIVKISERNKEENLHLEEDSLDNTIFHLEESIKEKEALVKDLWKSLKLQKKN